MRVRRVLSARITVTQAILALGVFVMFVSLLSDGNLPAGLGVLVVATVAAAVLRAVHRRRLPARTERLEETAVLSHTCEVVWGVIKPAEMAPLVQPALRRGYQVPGTPEGLGEQQAFELDDGTTVVIEVIEYEPSRRAVMRQVSPRMIGVQRNVQAVEPVDDGCVYTAAIEVEVQPGDRIRPEFERLWRSETREQMARIRAVLDSNQPGAAPTG